MRTGIRSLADIVVGAAAALSLLALVAGVPALLLAVARPPIPRTAPSLALLAKPLGIHAVLGVCALVTWLAWLQLVWCVAAEVTAAIRNSGMPRRVPLATGMQAVVHRLVSATLLISATALGPGGVAATVVPASAAVAVAPFPSAPGAAASHPAASLAQAGSALPHGHARPAGGSPQAAHGDPGATPCGEGSRGSASSVAPAGGGARHAAVYAVPATASMGPAAAGHVTAASVASVLDASGSLGGDHSEKVYVVRPPEGRFHESLWEIAERYLGNGRRYREIFELNKGRPQRDGSMLTIASLIRPGWILRMPWDAHGPGITVVEAGGGPRSHQPGPGRSAPSQKDGQSGGGTVRLPTRSRLADTAPGRAAHKAAVGAAAGAHSRHGGGRQASSRPRLALNSGAAVGNPAVPAGLVVTGLLAAALLAALERRRRRQLWQRVPGRRVATPSGEAARAEVSLLQAADADAAAILDIALRRLGRDLAGQGRTPPGLMAVHLGEQVADLWISPPDRDPPGPWFAVADGEVWRLPLERLPLDTAGQESRPAEDPLAAGALPPMPYPALAPIGEDAAGEVLVDLAAAPGLVAVTGPAQQVRAMLTAIAAALATSAWAGQMRLVLAGFDGDLATLAPSRVHAARTLAEALAAAGNAADETPSRRSPVCLISLAPPSQADFDAVLSLADRAVCLVGADVPGAAWTWELDEDGTLWTGELGLEVQASQLAPEEWDAVAGLFRVAADEAGVKLGPPAADAAPAGRLNEDPAVTVEIALLGPASVRAPGHIRPDRLPLATEIAAYLATHPSGVHPNTLAAAIWPRGVSPQARDSVLERVMDWLGADGIGRPHLAADAGGRLRLGSQVGIDWQVFQALLARASMGDEERWLDAALRLVRGPFLAERPSGRYTWLAAGTLEAEVAARVADAAHQLCAIRLARGESRGAMEAASAGLRLARYDELLWRDLLTAAHATGDDGLLREAVSHVRAKAATDHVRPLMSPRTESLISDLLPRHAPRAAPA